MSPWIGPGRTIATSITRSARQHGHLRAAFDLEHADRVGRRDHVVDGFFVDAKIGKAELAPIMPVEQRKTLAQGREHAEREHVDLENAQGVEIVLVPFDRRAALHRGWHDRHDFVEPVARDDKTAGVLRQMAREPRDFMRQFDGLGEARLRRVEAGARSCLSVRRFAASPHGARERRQDVLGKAEGLCGFTNGRAAAIADDGRRQRRIVVAVAFVDVLDHLFAPLVFEIDVDIRRLVALLRYETFEQQAAADRIDFSNAEAIADGGICGRTTSLRENPLAARITHDVVDGQEIGRVSERRHDLQFVRDHAGGLRGNAVRPARPCALGDVIFESRLFAVEARAKFGRIIVGEFVEREIDAIENARRLRDRIGRIGEQSRHFARAFQMPLGVEREQSAGVVERSARTDAGEDVGKFPPFGRVHENVVDGDQRQAGFARKLQAPSEIASHARTVGGRQREPETVGRGLLETLQNGRSPLLSGRGHDMQS